MFAIFRRRASKFVAELAALRKKEVVLAQRAQAHIEVTHSVIATLFEEIDDAHLVVDELEGRDVF